MFETANRTRSNATTTKKHAEGETDEITNTIIKAHCENQTQKHCNCYQLSLRAIIDNVFSANCARSGAV